MWVLHCPRCRRQKPPSDPKMGRAENSCVPQCLEHPPWDNAEGTRQAALRPLLPPPAPQAALAPPPEQMMRTQVFVLGSAALRSPSVTRKASAG